MRGHRFRIDLTYIQGYEMQQKQRLLGYVLSGVGDGTGFWRTYTQSSPAREKLFARVMRKLTKFPMSDVSWDAN